MRIWAEKSGHRQHTVFLPGARTFIEKSRKEIPTDACRLVRWRKLKPESRKCNGFSGGDEN